MKNIRLFFLTLKYLLTRDPSMFWYSPCEYPKFTYRGVPIILREEIPENIVLVRQRNGTFKEVNIKTGRITTLKKVKWSK